MTRLVKKSKKKSGRIYVDLMKTNLKPIRAWAIIEDDELLWINSNKQVCIYESKLMARKEIDIDRRKSEKIIQVEIRPLIKNM